MGTQRLSSRWHFVKDLLGCVGGGAKEGGASCSLRGTLGYAAEGIGHTLKALGARPLQT